MFKLLSILCKTFKCPTKHTQAGGMPAEPCI